MEVTNGLTNQQNRPFIRTDTLRNGQSNLHVIEGDVDFVAGLVHQHGVAVGEGRSAHILATDADIVSLNGE